MHFVDLETSINCTSIVFLGALFCPLLWPRIPPRKEVKSMDEYREPDQAPEDPSTYIPAAVRDHDGRINLERLSIRGHRL